MNLPDPIRQDIIKYAKRYHLARVLLFGSRARGDNHSKSDIDLAVSGGDILPFTFAVDEELPTLLSVDVVNLDAPLQDELRQAIEREGVILYEKDEKLC